MHVSNFNLAIEILLMETGYAEFAHKLQCHFNLAIEILLMETLEGDELLAFLNLISISRSRFF